MTKNSTLSGKYIMMLAIITFFSVSLTQAQTSPKLRFVSPVLISGINGQKDATYKFSNVISGVDAFVKIENIKNGAKLVNIDDSTLGYYDAWQPQIGGPGTYGSSYIKWAIEFKTTSGSEYKFPVMDLTAVDVDGDNVRVREFVDVNGQSSYDVPTIIPSLLSVNNTPNNDNEDGDDDQENLHAVGPIMNRANIDTNSLDVKVNYHFINKSKIKISIGSQIDNNGTTGPIATDRYSSLYFRSTSNVLIVLPITYRAFDVTLNNNSVNLFWMTDAETRNDHFEVEKSFDQINFSTVGIILGAQSVGNTNKYNFNDAVTDLAAHKVIYYRLKQVDVEGNSTYSVVKMVRMISVSKAFVQVSPNPFMDKLNVNFVSDASGAAEVRLISAAGNLVKITTSSITKGNNNIQLQDLNSQASGLYIANIIINGKVVASLKVVK